MSAAEITAWVVIALGIGLAGIGVRATFYFGDHQRALHGTEGQWVVNAFWRICATITAVCLLLTLTTIATLRYGAIDWIELLQIAASVWLLLIPGLLMQTFRSREGQQ